MIQAFTRSSTMPIGVDIGAHAVRLLQFTAGPAGLTVAAAASQPLPAGLTHKDEQYHEAVAEALQTALSRASFRGRRVVSSLPRGGGRGQERADAPDARPRAGAGGAVRGRRAHAVGQAADRSVPQGRRGATRFGHAARGAAAGGGRGVHRGARRGVDHVRAAAAGDRRDPHGPGAGDHDPGGPEPTRAGSPRRRCCWTSATPRRRCWWYAAGRVLFYKAIEIGAAALDKAVGRQLRLAPADAMGARHAALDPSKGSADPGEADGPRGGGACVGLAYAHADRVGQGGGAVPAVLRRDLPRGEAGPRAGGRRAVGVIPAGHRAVGGGGPWSCGCTNRWRRWTRVRRRGSSPRAARPGPWPRGMSLRGGRRQSDGPPLPRPRGSARAS